MQSWEKCVKGFYTEEVTDESNEVEKTFFMGNPLLEDATCDKILQCILTTELDCFHSSGTFM